MGNRLSKRSFTIADVLDYRLEIFGITALWILIYHVNHRVHIPEFRGSYWVANFLNRGNSGVDIFVLLSWVGNRSLEVYMVHVLLMRILTYHNIWRLLPSMAWYPIILAVTAFLAEGVRLLSKKCALPRR